MSIVLASPESRQAAGWPGPRGGIPDAARLDLAGVDGGLLLGLAGIGQVGEEIRPFGMELAAEPRIQPTQDLAAGVQTFLFRPGPTVAILGLPGGRPPLVAEIDARSLSFELSAATCVGGRAVSGRSLP